MAQITIEIKDGYEVTIAKEFAKFSYGKIVPTTQWVFGGSGVSFDSDYQAVLDRGTALGYTLPSASQRTKQNDETALNNYLASL